MEKSKRKTKRKRRREKEKKENKGQSAGDAVETACLRKERCGDLPEVMASEIKHLHYTGFSIKLALQMRSYFERN